MVDLNVENYLIRIKSLLKGYSQPIRSIDEFPYKKLFSKLIVLERNKIIFVIGKRNDLIILIYLKKRSILIQFHVESGRQTIMLNMVLYFF